VKLTREAICDKVLAAVVSMKRLPRERVTLDSSLVELGYDSLDTINLLFEVEEAFNISVPDEQARAIRSVREIVDGVERLVAEREASAA
jgi:acyl carrier protein